MTGAQESVVEAGNVGASDLAGPELAEAAAVVVNAEWTEHEPAAAAVEVAETALTAAAAAAEVGTDATRRRDQINHRCTASSASEHI